MNTSGMLEKILNDLKLLGGIETSVVASRDGLVIYSNAALKMNSEVFAAMSATMLGAAETATTELGKGIPERIIVESMNGKIIAIGAGPKALLIILTEPEASLGLILIEAAKASDKIREAMG